MIIRPATAEDMPRVVEMIKETYSDVGLSKLMTGFDSESMSEFWASIALSDVGVLLLAVDDDGAIMGRLGAMLCDWPQGKKCKMAQGLSFVVGKKFRGHGVGSALLGAFLAWAKERKANIATITTLKSAPGTAQMLINRGFGLGESTYCKRL